ncbi:MAG: EAL domain-containing protein [Actinomycetia bacterium]|nr:EAL domain-containing protein [Actinomycetes bacterium]
MATALAAFRLYSVASEISSNSELTRDVSGGVSDLRLDSESIADLLDGSTLKQKEAVGPDTDPVLVGEQHRRPTIQEIALSYSLARRQVDIAGDDISKLSDPRNDVLYSDLVGAYDEVAVLLDRASESGDFDYSAGQTLAPPLRSTSRRLVDNAFAEVRQNASDNKISIQLELLIVFLPLVSLALLFLLGKENERDVQRRLAEATQTLEAGHRFTKIEAEALERIAQGRRTSDVRNYLAQVIDRESSGEWTLGQANVVAKSANAPAIPSSFTGMIPGILEVAAERDRITDSLVSEARTDPLTGLANRAALTGGLSSAMRGSRDDDVAFLFIDLSEFKDINDNFGHRTGDAVLREIASRIEAECPDNGLAGRIGGDEFGMLLTETDSAAARDVAHRILEAVRAPISCDPVDLTVGACIGIAFARAEHDNSEELLMEADQAMYKAKAVGEQIVLSDARMRSAIDRRQAIEDTIVRAIDAENMELRYQPIVDTGSGRIAGVEALVRLRSGERLMQPSEFLRVAEETGLIIQIDRYVMTHAARQVASWNTRDDIQLNLAVNISGVHLNQGDPLGAINAAVKQSGLQMEDLTIEISEGVFLNDPTAVAEKMATLRRLGAKFAIDDFGVGYSSLAQLRRLPIDKLKIDRAFTQELVLSSEGDAVVRAILDVAGALNLETVAEGVESVEQHQRLQDLGCEYSQGYFFAKPMTAGELAKQWLHKAEELQHR